MPPPDFIYAGTMPEYERFIEQVRPSWRAVPALISTEQLKERKRPRVHAVGSFYDRPDVDAINEAMAALKGEWVP